MYWAALENPNELKISTSVVTALRDTGYAVSVLFAPALIALLILVVLWFVRSQVMLSTGLIASAALLCCNALQALLMTPYAIAVHRFIILGERTMSYRIAPAEPRFWRFFGLSLVLSVLSAPADIPDILLPSMSPEWRAFLSLVLSIPGAVIAIRAILLFPAVAVDAPGAYWRQAMADTAGHTWRIFFIMMGTVLALYFPLFIVVVLPIRLVTGVDIMADAAGKMLFVGIVALLAYTSVVAIASRLYQRIGVRVSGPSRLA